MVSGAEVKDALYPFQIEAGLVRGRLIRLNKSIDTILAAHAYPQAVAALLAETLAVATVLAGSLKYEGIFTIQAQGDGPLSLLVADVTSGGDLRGYARFNEERLAATAATSLALLGKGYLAFTVDQGENTERYQGIVELTGDTLSEAVGSYFQQSEQLETSFKVAAQPDIGGWRAAALMIQRMPVESEGAPILTAEEADESWNRATILLDTLKMTELLDPTLSAEILLYRLYHDDGLHVFDSRLVQAKCRCSAERLGGALRSLPVHDREEILQEKGSVEVVCEFCKTVYSFSEKDFQ